VAHVKSKNGERYEVDDDGTFRRTDAEGVLKRKGKNSDLSARQRKILTKQARREARRERRSQEGD
jgi:hypothetical protein